MTVLTVSLAIVSVVSLIGPALAVVPGATNPANELETFPRLKGTNQVGFHDFIRMMASSGAQSQVVGRVPPGSNPAKVAAALQQRTPIEEGKVCHIEALVPQKISGRCIALDGAPTCMAKDRMETNYRDCLGLSI
ncbi:hypothetical protein BIW11_07250 [Tropilaelaps mercedesae]|uniref:Uncharacterized protein n=1 Tax=Tropilaelaps mercedesae TaxID=418985 RepID=A0A1V9XUV8_9ACAR|nr:hypothetical protein BIW11_07250 [Tropilaelaps mercedesae]